MFLLLILLATSSLSNIKNSDNGVAPYLSTNKSFIFLGSSSICFFNISYSFSSLATFIAPIGHSFSHIPQEIHLSLSIDKVSFSSS